jgi:hypothetical protein
MSTGSICHYCGELQPRRKLRPLELSSTGDVLVCREIETCHRRARSRLFTAASIVDPRPTRATRQKRVRRAPRWAIVLALIVIGVLLLPHFAFAGHHWRIWFLA